MNRHEDALFIQKGACNIRAIARTLVKAADAAANEGMRQEEDAAVRLIVHQLAFLAKTTVIDNESSEYNKLMDECEAKAKESA